MTSLNSIDSLEMDTISDFPTASSTDPIASSNLPERETRVLTRDEAACFAVKALLLTVLLLVIALAWCAYYTFKLHHEVRGENCL